MRLNCTCLPLFSIILLLTIPGCKPSARVEVSPEPVPSKPEEKTIAAAFSVRDLDGAAAADLIDGNEEIIILDIRTPEEFAAGHIQNALNINFKDPGFRDEVAKLDTGGTYLIHCLSGGRSTSSLPVFEELGFSEIHHLAGGFNDWKASGNAYVTD